MIQPVLEDPFIVKVMQNAKYDINVMTRYGVDLRNIEDTMLMSLAMNAGKHRHGMDDLARIYMKHRTIKFSEVTGRGPSKVSFDYVPLEPATRYGPGTRNVRRFVASSVKTVHVAKDALDGQK